MQGSSSRFVSRTSSSFASFVTSIPSLPNTSKYHSAMSQAKRFITTSPSKPVSSAAKKQVTRDSNDINGHTHRNVTVTYSHNQRQANNSQGQHIKFNANSEVISQLDRVVKPLRNADTKPAAKEEAKALEAAANAKPKKTRSYDYSKDNALIRCLPSTEITHPFLLDIIPTVDQSLIDLETLERLSKARYDRLVDYLTNLNKDRHNHPRLSNDQIFDQFEKTLITVNSQKNILFSIDIEAFERKSDYITEIGISIYDPFKDASSLFPNILNIHILIKDYLHLRNGSFVHDNKDNFLGGSSIILSLAEAKRFVQTLIDHYFIKRQDMGMNGVLVGHSLDGDVSWLKSVGIYFPTGAKVVDSQKLYNFADTINRSSLGAILQRLNIPHSHLHNGGNDAYFTLVVLMKLSDPNFRVFHNLDSFEANEAYRKLFLERQNAPLGKPEKKARKQMQSEFVANTKLDSFQDALHLVYEK